MSRRNDYKKFVIWVGILFFVPLFSSCVEAESFLKGVKLNFYRTPLGKQVQITSSELDTGPLGNKERIFDGYVTTLARTPNVNPAWVQVALPQPRILRKFRVHCSYGDSYDWWVEAANSEADMKAQDGSFVTIVPKRNFKQGTWDEVELAKPVTAKIFRLNVKRIGGDNFVHINEWELFADVPVDRLRLSPLSLTMAIGQKQRFKAFAFNDALDEVYSVESGIQWQLSSNIGKMSDDGVLSATTVGTAEVRASLGDVTGLTARVKVEENNSKPDVDVLYIERTPRIAFDPSDLKYTSGLPAPDQEMTYLAHVKNWGPAEVIVPFEWWFDGALSSSGTVTIASGEEVTVPFKWNWKSDDHTLEFRADPKGTLTELSETNNIVSIRTNALLVGMWVEQSLYDYMHQNQYRMKDGGNSFEDWGKRMLLAWNEMLERAVYPHTPQGVLDRVALDKVVVVPDGALPLHGGLATNHPDKTDLTVDMQWGYPWNANDIQRGKFYGIGLGKDRPFYLDLASIHEMNHARFLIDLYALDINQPLAPKEPKILLTDDEGKLVARTPYMPVIGWDIVYYNKWRDIMSDHIGIPLYDAFSASVWNWKHHKRGRGNYNAPPDIGIFLQDLPERNHFRFIDQNGVPLVGAQVYLYQSQRQGNFDNTADYTATTDGSGTITLPRNPFTGDKVRIGVGSTNGIFIFKVRYRGQLYFMFQEVTDFNLEYWRGRTADAYYTRQIDLRDNPARVPQNAWLGNYFSDGNFEDFIASRTDASINFKWEKVPAQGMDALDYSVYWLGNIEFDEGMRRFTITSDGGVQLIIDGRLVFDQWNNQELKTWTPSIYTLKDAPFVNSGSPAPDRKFHRVEVRYRHRGNGPAVIQIK